jgi:hypothetical protein
MDRNDINFQQMLDDLFDLPMTVTEDPRLRRLYFVLTMKMVDEVSHLAVPTSTYYQIERIAHLYAVMRENERLGKAFTGSNAQKAMNSFWMELIKDFNKTVVAADIQRTREMLKTITQVVMMALEHNITDEAVRTRTATQIIVALEQAGAA